MHIMSAIKRLYAGITGSANRGEGLGELRASRTRLLVGAHEDRRRFERDLDGAQQQLSVLSMKVRMLEGRLEREGSEARHLASEALADLEGSMSGLRGLAHRVYPAVLRYDGIEAALTAASERLGLGVAILSGSLSRHSSELEAVVYFSCLEVLGAPGGGTGDPAPTISLLEGEGALRFEIRVRAGGASPPGRILGLAPDFVRTLGGDIEIDADGDQTVVSGLIPL
jgi:hypothetical protein